MANEIVTIERDGEILELEVPAGTTEADIESFLRFNGNQEKTIGQRVGGSIAEAGRGIAGLADLPVTLINAGISGLNAADAKIAESLGQDQSNRAPPPQLPQPFTEAGVHFGAFPEERPGGVIPRFMELMGATVIPFGVALKGGELAMQSLKAVPSVLEQMGIMTATQPGKAAAWDIASNFSASGSGAVARNFTDNEAVIAMAELGGSFLPTAAILLPKITPGGQLVNKSKEAIQETLAPFTEAGAKPKAARRLQTVAADPNAAAASVTDDSLLPVLQQTGDPNLIKLQNNILDKNPALREQISDQLELAIQALKGQADFGGDIQRARHLLNIRSQMAVEEAALAVEKLGANATPRQISVAATKAVQKALDDAIDIERVIWANLDTGAPADVVNARQTLSDIMVLRSADADPDDIPKWLASKLNESPIDDKLLAQLQKQGLVTEDGVIDPAIRAAMERSGAFKARQRTLDDVQTIRSRVLREIRAEKAKDAPNRNKIRILNEVQNSLLDDMTATGVDGVDDARAFSNALNERFRRGRVGKMMGFDTTGAEKIPAEDMLDEVVFGTRSASTTKRFIETASEAPDMVLSFIKARYLEATSDGATINAGAHDRFVKSMKKKGMFELFPELEGQLAQAKTASDAARALNVPEGQINTTRINRDQSRAALLLQADPGTEMSLILRSNNPQAAVRDVMKVVQKDLRAVNGMKSAFAEEIIKLSAGNAVDQAGRSIPNGLAMKRLLGEYKPVMRALHMNDAEMGRLNRVAEQIRLAQVKPGTGDIGAGILDEPLLAPIDLLARFVGARTGGQLGSEMGSRLVLANFMSQQGRDRIRTLTTSKAEELLIEVVSDPVLFRELSTRPQAPAARQIKAANALEAALLRQESVVRRTTALASASEDEE